MATMFMGFMMIVTMMVVISVLGPQMANVWQQIQARRLATAGAANLVAQHDKPASQREADQLEVREMADGGATLLVRERSMRGVATGQLIIWSGKKKRRIQDSYYDLGHIPAEGLDEKIIGEFFKMANDRMRELAGKPVSKPATAATSEAQPQAATNPAATAQQSTVTVEDNQQPEPSIKLKKHPSVYRGTILKVGMMTNVGNDGMDFECYGLKYRTVEGVEDTLWGKQLRTALHEAKANVGDDVEILKIGRKTVEKGKAPMNLYQITKLQ